MSELKIMTYNICKYNNDQGGIGFPESILDEKVSNLKRMFMEYAPDIIGLQEDRQYLDEKKTIPASAYLFAPVWNHRSGMDRETARSKYSAFESSLVQFTDEVGKANWRTYRRLVYNYHGKRLVFISCHPMPGKQYVNARMEEFTELFKDINNTKYDYCIVAGDFNTITDEDKVNLTNICNQNRFKMAIGSYLPWLVTCPGSVGTSQYHPYSLDNILVSGNMNIVQTKVLNEWHSRLYSDHVPVVATIRF